MRCLTRRARRISFSAVLFTELVDQLLLARIYVGHGGAPRPCRPVADVNAAPVSKKRNGHFSRSGQRRFVVQGTDQNLARPSEKPDGRFGSLVLLEQQAVLEGDCHLRGEQVQDADAIGRKNSRRQVVLEIEDAEQLGLASNG